MLRSFIILAVLPLMALAPPPLVPEDVHSDANGPPELCGYTGTDVADLKRRVLASPGFVEEGSSDQYQVFIREEEFVQFVFPRAGFLTFPMATCRKVTANSDGSSSISREMHCDGSRDECDRIFLQFQNLDEGLTRAMSVGPAPTS